jgi:hypothetical protein
MLNEYLKQTLNISSIDQNRNQDVNIIDDINNRIINKDEQTNNDQQNIYRKNNKNNNIANIELNENDIREYAINIPVKSIL